MASDAQESVPLSEVNPHALDLVAPATDDVGDSADDKDALGSHREAPDDTANTPDDGGTEDETLPPRLKGKTKAQIADEFARLESEYGRQGNELGEVRSLLREFLEKTLQPPNDKGSDNSEADVTNLLENLDPETAEAVQKYVDNKLSGLEQDVRETRRVQSKSDFDRRHPNYQETANTGEFQDWVKGSKYRSRLFARAHDFDFDAADELFVAWEEAHPTDQAEGADNTPSAETGRKKALRRNSTESGGAGKSAGSNKKVYKAAELARLYNEDREKYNAMGDEIKLAFQEGRVK